MGSSIRCNIAHWVTTCIIALALAWPAPALTCSDTAEKDWDTCAQAMQSNLSESEKQLIVGSLMSNAYYTNHSFIRKWNTGINFTEAPYGVNAIDKDYIRDAWFSIVAIMPSVWLKNDLLSPGYGQILSAYNYWIEIPVGTEPGDCKTEFSLIENTSKLSIYLNNEYIGDARLTSFNTSQNLSFNAFLNIKATIEVQHYKERKYCCRWDENGCHKICTVCHHENTEYRTNEVNLIDSKQAILDKPIIDPEVRAINRYRNTTYGILNISNFAAFSLDFANSSLRQYNYQYEFNRTFEPYDILTIRAIPHRELIKHNMNLEHSTKDYRFFIPDSEICSLRYYDFFIEWVENCSINQTAIPLVLKTDKRSYRQNESINLSIEPANTTVTINYGNESWIAANSIELPAQQYQNRIEAYRDEQKADVVFHVKDGNTIDFWLNFGIFTSVLYSVYLVFRKYAIWM